jgi:hypothetical protein
MAYNKEVAEVSERMAAFVRAVHDVGAQLDKAIEEDDKVAIKRFAGDLRKLVNEKRHTLTAA